MSDCFMLAIDHDGSLFQLSLETQKWSQVDVNDSSCRELPLKKISSTENCIWAIGADQNVYVSVFETDLPIRVQVSCYENQRWSITHGWSEKSLFFTDRWRWSSEDGKQKTEKESFLLPSSAWVWCGDWYIDDSIECGREGWQYALDFPSTYYEKPGQLMFVRRRKWARYRELVDFNAWMKVPSYSSNDPYEDVCVGGYKIPGQVDGFLAVWAITFSGKVLYRHGVSRVSPEGEYWMEISTDQLSLVQISTGPTGMVWGCTWNGMAVVRKGVSHSQPMGTCWDVVSSPGEDPLHTVAVGEKSIWAVSKNSKIYFWRGENLNNSSDSHDLDASFWVEMIGSFLTVDIGPNDQVWVIGKEDHQLYIRTNITPDEPSGHEWKRFACSSEETIPELICYICSGACFVDASFFEKIACRLISSVSSLSLSSNSGEYQWRNDILKCLCERNNKIIEKDFFSQSAAESASSWNKRVECLYLVDKVRDTWCKCHLKLQLGIADDYHTEPMLLVYYMKKARSYNELLIPLTAITCIHRLNYAAKPHNIAIEYQTSKKSCMAVVSMDKETLVNEWIYSLHYSAEVKISNDYIKLWATTNLGDVFQCDMDITGHSASDYKWSHVHGHLCKIVSGQNGITWGISYDGKPYVYNERFFNGKTASKIHQNIEDHYIYENHRWNPLEGYTNRLLISDRWHWSDESGVYECSKQNYVLPYASFKWVGEWMIDYHQNADRYGWQYAIDFPRSYHKHRGINDYVRRRRWKRSCIVSWSGPWMEVKTDVKLCDISISMDSNDTPSCWVVTCKGDVMVRNGVTSECPQGTSWTYILTEAPVSSISAGSKSHIWCVRRDGSCYLRAGFQSNNLIGTQWFHVLKEDILINRVSAGRNIVLGLDKQGTLYVRSSVTDIYPEGTKWDAALNDITDMSVNSKDQAYIIQGSDVKIWLNVGEGRFETCQLITLLRIGWTGISCRSLCFTEDHLKKVTEPKDELRDEAISGLDESSTDDMENDEFGSSGKVNPYSIDIYSFYNKSHGEMDGLFTENLDSNYLQNS